MPEGRCNAVAQRETPPLLVRCMDMEGHEDRHFFAFGSTEGWKVERWGDLPTAESRSLEPDGTGFARPVVLPEVPYVMEGAFVRTVLDTRNRRGLVVVEATGRWNGDADAGLTLIMRHETADETGRYMQEAAERAPMDWAHWLAEHETTVP